MLVLLRELQPLRCLRALFGSINVVADEHEIRFEADLRATQLSLLRAAGGSANNVVAGARNAVIYHWVVSGKK